MSYMILLIEFVFSIFNSIIYRISFSLKLKILIESRITITWILTIQKIKKVTVKSMTIEKMN